MNVDNTLLISRLLQSSDPLEIHDILLGLGFNGLLFQRWYPEEMDNWEPSLPEGFLEIYYGAQVYKDCPVARAVHSFTRDYTFTEARAAFTGGMPEAERANKLFEQFDLNDGVVLFTGTNKMRSAVILTTEKVADPLMREFGGLLALGARQLAQQLHPRHDLLSRISRDDPKMSNLQNKILQMQIDHPEMSNQEMANALNMSPKTLHAHHKKIAKKNGVTTFAGAVLKHLQQSR